MIGQAAVAVVFIREAALIYPWFAAAARMQPTHRQRQRKKLRRTFIWLAFSAVWMVIYVADALVIGFSEQLFTGVGWTSIWSIAILASSCDTMMQQARGATTRTTNEH